jgi:predicted kinase
MKAYIMVGAPGAGKSTHVSTLRDQHAGAVVICGDSIRAELYGDADIQGNYSEIHDRMIEILEDSVGQTVILDGTHYRASYRKEAITMVSSYGYNDITAIVVDRPLDVCLSQNASRSRNVPQHVIERMHNSLRASIRGINNEGFTEVKYV